MPRPKSAPRRRKAQPPDTTARLLAILTSNLARVSEPALRERLERALDGLKSKAAA
jgi:hypothetical protein